MDSLNNSPSSLPVHLNGEIKTNVCLDEIHQCKFTHLLTLSFVLSDNWNNSEILIGGDRAQSERVRVVCHCFPPKIHGVSLISSEITVIMLLVIEMCHRAASAVVCSMALLFF